MSEPERTRDPIQIVLYTAEERAWWRECYLCAAKCEISGATPEDAADRALAEYRKRFTEAGAKQP